MTMDRAGVPRDFHYADGEFYGDEMSFEFLKKFYETKNELLVNKIISKQLQETLLTLILLTWIIW